MRNIVLSLFVTFFLVGAVASGQTISLTANPTSIVAGQTSVLTETVSGTGPTGIPWSVTAQTTTVAPTATTTYTASFLTASASATVTVTPAPPPPAAMWIADCNTTRTSSNCPSDSDLVPMGRGYDWAMPYDSANDEALIYAGCKSETSIYSRCLWSWNLSTGTFRLRVRATTDPGYGCANTANLLNVGHPLGYSWFDTRLKQWMQTSALCSGYDAAFTSRYDAVAHAALSAIPHWPYGTLFGGYYASCDGTYNCGPVAWDSGAVYIDSYGKALVGINFGQYSAHIVEFDGTAYHDVSDLLVGADGIACANASQQCPQPSWGFGFRLLSDGTNMWVFGGTDSPGNLYNDLYKYEPSLHKFTKISPAGGVKPTGHTAFAMMAYDSKRNRFILYSGDDTLWQYSLATNTWSQFTASGHGPVLNGFDPQSWDHGNACTYSAIDDTFACAYGRGQNLPIGAFRLKFN